MITATGTDTRTFMVIAAAMMAAALASAVVPAIRAIRIDPIQALRAEQTAARPIVHRRRIAA